MVGALDVTTKWDLEEAEADEAIFLGVQDVVRGQLLCGDGSATRLLVFDIIL